MPHTTGPDSQRDVQRLMGRCLLRLQQYERLMKAMLAHHELGGAADEWEARRSARIEKFADKSLGTLVKTLFDSYVVEEGAECPELDDATAPTDRISMSVRFRMEMPSKRRAEVKAAIEELVRMRNDLVHHLIERYDLWTEEGCAAAAGHLERCYDRVDHHIDELCRWAQSLDEARLEAVSLASSQAFRDLVLDGIAPSGTVDWPRAGIVRALRDAIRANGADGWLRLADARAWIAQHHPEQEPARYGCRSWQQVLSESRAFRLEYRREGERRVPWYCAAT